jgi:hypothetical protein
MDLRRRMHRRRQQHLRSDGEQGDLEDVVSSRDDRTTQREQGEVRGASGSCLRMVGSIALRHDKPARRI